jgi:hypothetical protein
MSTEFGSTNRTAAQAPALVHVNWGEVMLFVLLAYGLAWVWSGFWLLPYLGTLLTQSTTPTDMVERLGPAATLGTMLTPMIAAVIMRIFVSKEGLKGSVGLLRSPKYYLAALAIPAVFVTAVVLIVQALGLGEFRWSEAGLLVYVALMLDTNCPWTPEQARHMTLKLRQYDLHWLEEPIFPPEDFAAIARLRAKLKYRPVIFEVMAREPALARMVLNVR